MDCKINPISAFLNTNLANKMNSYQRLADRILRFYGCPTINAEISRDALYENISKACEMYTTYAGFSKEFLVFHSSLYKQHEGIRLDNLFSVRDKVVLSENDKTHQLKVENQSKMFDTTFNADMKLPKNVYTCIEYIPLSSYTNSALSGVFGMEKGISPGQIINQQMYDVLTNPISGGTTDLSANFLPSWVDTITLGGEEPKTKLTTINNAFDYDLMDYRKVNSVFELNVGENTGINTLFTIEQTLAQQTYFSYAMGNYGFDLISWYTLKNWLDTREKVLSVNPIWKFNERTQILTIYPEPITTRSQYWAVVGCAVEKPLRDVIKAHWVQEYATALCGITIGMIRGKYGSLALFGGGILNKDDILSYGLKRKEELEKELFEGTTPGFGQDIDPAAFLIG